MLVAASRALPPSCCAGPDDLPVRLHGDEGPGAKSKNVLVINMSFPFSHSGESWKQDVICQMRVVCTVIGLYAISKYIIYVLSGLFMAQDTLLTRLALCNWPASYMLQLIVVRGQ